MSLCWTSALHLQQETASQCLVPPVFLSTHCGGSSGGQLCSCVFPHSGRPVTGQCTRHILEMNHGDYASLLFQDKSMFPLQTLGIATISLSKDCFFTSLTSVCISVSLKVTEHILEKNRQVFHRSLLEFKYKPSMIQGQYKLRIKK